MATSLHFEMPLRLNARSSRSSAFFRGKPYLEVVDSASLVANGHILLFLLVGRYKIKYARYKIQDIRCKTYKTYKMLKLLDVPLCFNFLQVTYNNMGVIMKQVGTTLPDYMPD
jgi:hypothetical protein